MDCHDAREILSEVADRGIPSTPGAGEARAHCTECAGCREWAEVLVKLSEAPTPKAPFTLVDDILERAAAMAEAQERERTLIGTEAAGTASDEDGAEPRVAAMLPPAAVLPETPQSRWPRVIAITGAAAAIVIVLVLTFQGFRSLRSTGKTSAPSASTNTGQPRSVQLPPEAQRGLRRAPAAGSQASPDAASPGSTASTMTVQFVVFGDEVYRSLGTRTPDTSALTRSGSLSSALGSADAPFAYTVLRSKTDPSVVFIEPQSGSYVGFSRVTRQLRGKLFALAPGTTVDRYGIWPTLPSGFQTPTSADGTPSFGAAGSDDSGQQVFTPDGADPGRGFAVPPDTPASDPAAGDPNWTWWLPAR